MEPIREQIAPEIVQAIIAQATANGLSVNEYLSKLLGLKNGHEIEGASTAQETGGESQKLSPYELVEDVLGSEDSSLPEDPNSPPQRPPMYHLVAEKLRKQGLKTS